VALSWFERLIEHARQVAQRAGRPFLCVASGSENKQAAAQKIAQPHDQRFTSTDVLRFLGQRTNSRFS
jgi:hypothetical protein